MLNAYSYTKIFYEGKTYSGPVAEKILRRLSH
jgi:hypothetical protein